MPRSHQYRLEVIQNPVRARCCGFGEKDRRLLDPPAIIQLFVEHGDGSLGKVTEIEPGSAWVVHCDLYDEDKKETRSVVIVPSSMAPPTPQHIVQGRLVLSLKTPKATRNLVGTISANANRLINEFGEQGIYFVFHDLSVRTEGRFTLRFCLMDVAGLFPPAVTADVFSGPFTVYTAKKFPGMTKSTALSKAFANQGIKIITRREGSYTRASDQFYAMDVNDEENEASSSRDTLVQPQHKSLSIASIILPSDTETTPHLPATTTARYTRIPITQYLADPSTEDSI